MSAFKNKLKEAVYGKLQPQEFLKYITPFEIAFKLKILANRNGHDFAILFQVTGDDPFIEDPRDLDAFLVNLLAERKSKLKVTSAKVKYDGEIFMCVYIDFPKKEEKPSVEKSS